MLVALLYLGFTAIVAAGLYCLGREHGAKREAKNLEAAAKDIDGLNEVIDYLFTVQETMRAQLQKRAVRPAREADRA